MFAYYVWTHVFRIYVCKALTQSGFTCSHTPDDVNLSSFVCLPSPVSSQMLLNGRPQKDWAHPKRR